MKIMIINDSRAMRLFLEETIRLFPECQIIGSYFDANHALNELEFKKPDVIILDLEMPKMDGISFLERLKDEQEFPIIVVSNYAAEGSEMVNDAMALGAVDTLKPPPTNSKVDFDAFKNILYHKITKASLKSKRYSFCN